MKYLLIVLALGVQPLYAQQGIKGKVEWISGNQMPGPDKVPGKPLPIVREIHIYEPTSPEQTASQGGLFYSGITTRLVKIIKSRKDGSFCVKLPPGEYSLFVKEDKGLFANKFDSQNRIHCITVEKGKFTTLNIVVNYEAAY